MSEPIITQSGDIVKVSGFYAPITKQDILSSEKKRFFERGTEFPKLLASQQSIVWELMVGLK